VLFIWRMHNCVLSAFYIDILCIFNDFFWPENKEIDCLTVSMSHCLLPAETPNGGQTVQTVQGIQSQIANERLKCTSLTFDRQTDHLFMYISYIYIYICIYIATPTALILCSVKKQIFGAFLLFYFFCWQTQLKSLISMMELFCSLCPALLTDTPVKLSGGNSRGICVCQEFKLTDSEVSNCWQKLNVC